MNASERLPSGPESILGVINTNTFVCRLALNVVEATSASHGRVGTQKWNICAGI